MASGLAFIPSPPVSGIHLGPLFVHFYALMYLIGIALAVSIVTRRWAAAGGDRELVVDVALWAVTAGITGGRIYFDLTTPFDITPHTWWGPLAVWQGGLGIWGGIAAGALVGGVAGAPGRRQHRPVHECGRTCAACRAGRGARRQLLQPGAVRQSEQLPWAVEISRAARLDGGVPVADLKFATFQPSFLYELIFDLAWAAVLVWLGRHRRIRPQGLFALYVAGYCGYRIFEETIRIDSSAHLFGMRLNFFIAVLMTAVGLTWFMIAQSRDISISSVDHGEPGTRKRRQGPHQEHGAAARS